MDRFMLRMIRDTEKKTSESHKTPFSPVLPHKYFKKYSQILLFLFYRSQKDSLTTSLFRSHLSKHNDLQRIFCVKDIKAYIKYSEVATIKNLYTIVNTQRYGECSLLTFLSERNSSTLCSQLTVKPTWLFPHRNEFSNGGK